MVEKGCNHCSKSWAAGSQVVEINEGEKEYMGKRSLHPLCSRCFLLWEKLNETQEDDRREFLGLQRLHKKETSAAEREHN